MMGHSERLTKGVGNLRTHGRDPEQATELIVSGMLQ